MLKSLHLGRGLAALSVAAFHLSGTLAESRYLGHPVLRDLTWRGNLGVDFFFVLSGFIIMFAHSRDVGRPGAVGPYLLKRFIRVYPIYWVYLTGFCLLLLLGLGSAASPPDGPAQWISSYLLISLQDFERTISPAWTLFHEVAFYAGFAILILHRRLGMLVLGLWFLASLAATPFDLGPLHGPLRTYLSTLNLDFLIGIGAYLAWKHGNVVTGRLLLAAGPAIVGGALLAESRGFDFPGFSIVYGLGFGALMTGLADWETRRRTPLLIPGAVLAGNASYTIYLTHEALEGLAAKVVLRLGGRAMEPHLVFVLVLSAAMIGGCLIYMFVEKPLLRTLRTVLIDNRRSKRAAELVLPPQQI